MSSSTEKLPKWPSTKQVCIKAKRAEPFLLTCLLGNRKRRRNYGDEEEFEQEQEERRRRAELDRLFKGFAEKISDAAREFNISVDIPFREISFNGVPNRSSVLMSPTTDALVQLTEPPFTVITLDEIEVAHLERIQVKISPFYT